MCLAPWSARLTIACLTGSLYACSGDSTPPPAPSTSAAQSSSSGGGASGVSNGGSGALTILLTDSPFSEAKSLLVTFSEVSVHRADPGQWMTLPLAFGTSRTCDLKKLQGATDLLGVGQLAAGKYTQIRLTVTKAEIFFDSAAPGKACDSTIAAPAGAKAAVEIPSGEVKLNNEFTLTSAGATITLDFDGDKSVRQIGGGNGNGNRNSGARYMMSPVIRVVSVH